MNNHTEREFEILENSYIKNKKGDRPIVLDFKDEIIALVDKFNNSGQSGGSAPYTASIISDAVKKLCMTEPISPITGEDDEWYDVDDYYQNKRESAIFKDKTKNRPYYLDAISFRDQNGNSWHMSNKENGCVSRQYIKSFPFTPKTFYVDVISTEVAPGDWESKLKDPEQLKEVFEYYDPVEGMEKWLS